MRIRWENILPLLLIILVIYVFIKSKPFFDRFFETVNRPSYYDDPGERVIKILMFGIVCLTILGVAKFMSRR